MKTMIEKIEGGERLSPDEVRQCFETILQPETPEEEIEGFLAALAKYEIDADLLTEAARVLRRRAAPVPLWVTPAVDTAGTGGDQSGSFNFSTAAALLVAACGVVVAKHGNRSITSKSGSADLLEALGIPIDQGAEEVALSIKKNKFGFMMAPLYHPATRRVQQVRRRLGVVTVFNFLGPLLNPAGVQHQVIGVFENKVRPIMAEAVRRLGLEKTWVVWGEGNLDEMSLCGKTYISEVTSKGIVEIVFQPEEVGFKRVSVEDLKGGDAEENAKILTKIFEGNLSGPLRDGVLLNAAAALVVVDRAEDLRQGIAIARRALEKKKGAALLEKLRVKK
jgi:anthranilate phosphoribosyltransferase